MVEHWFFAEAFIRCGQRLDVRPRDAQVSLWHHVELLLEPSPRRLSPQADWKQDAVGVMRIQKRWQA